MKIAVCDFGEICESLDKLGTELNSFINALNQPGEVDSNFANIKAHKIKHSLIKNMEVTIDSVLNAVKFPDVRKHASETMLNLIEDLALEVKSTSETHDIRKLKLSKYKLLCIEKELLKISISSYSKASEMIKHSGIKKQNSDFQITYKPPRKEKDHE